MMRILPGRRDTARGPLSVRWLRLDPQELSLNQTAFVYGRGDGFNVDIA